MAARVAEHPIQMSEANGGKLNHGKLKIRVPTDRKYSQAKREGLKGIPKPASKR